MIVVKEINKEVIRRTLNHLDESEELIRSTRKL
jgi:hypothetical protein